MKKNIKPKICFTASGILIVDNKVLLVKHRKLGFWLCPGGHIEENELPHQAAEREFFEETGIKVKVSENQPFVLDGDNVYTPLPLVCDLHWISRDNFNLRQKGMKPIKIWSKGCEQHFNQSFLVEMLNKQEQLGKFDVLEVTDMAWFDQSSLEKLETIEKIKLETKLAFEINQQKQRGKM